MSESLVKIGPAVPKIFWNKQTDRQKIKKDVWVSILYTFNKHLVKSW